MTSSAGLHSFGGDLEPDERLTRLGQGRRPAGAATTPDEDDAAAGGASEEAGTATAAAVIDVDAEPAGEFPPNLILL